MGDRLERMSSALANVARRSWRQIRSRRDSAVNEAIQRRRDACAPPDLVQRDGWHSWDATPWAHPWLTPDNLAASKRFDAEFFESLIATHGRQPLPSARFGFVGNLANNMALRALPLRRTGVPITIYLHPSDRYVMSQPGWELSDVILTTDETNVDRLAQAGVTLPDVPDVVTLPAPDNHWRQLVRLACDTPETAWPPRGVPEFVPQCDVLMWPSYFSYLPALTMLRSCTALFAAQSPYLAYLSRRPYLAAQTGGDLWLEASRQDELGTLQRQAYAQASAILATNPWAYSNARRFGFRHVVYVPLIIDTDSYAPGVSEARQRWHNEVGGDFFVLITARLDRKWKGSHIGLDGFARFAAANPGARLVVIGWGAHANELTSELDRRGLSGRYVRVPTSGKKRLLDYLRGADVVLDQFIIGYYGATALEAMSAGVPVIMRLARDQYDALCPTGAPPVLDAADEHDVCGHLESLAASTDRRAEVSRRSRAWVRSNHGVGVWRDHYVALLNAVTTGATFDFSRSPLNQPLSAAEREYHAAGLGSAPAFPNYEI